MWRCDVATQAVPVIQAHMKDPLLGGARRPRAHAVERLCSVDGSKTPRSRGQSCAGSRRTHPLSVPAPLCGRPRRIGLLLRPHARRQHPRLCDAEALRTRLRGAWHALPTRQPRPPNPNPQPHTVCHAPAPAWAHMGLSLALGQGPGLSPHCFSQTSISSVIMLRFLWIS